MVALLIIVYTLKMIFVKKIAIPDEPGIAIKINNSF